MPTVPLRSKGHAEPDAATSSLDAEPPPHSNTLRHGEARPIRSGPTPLGPYRPDGPIKTGEVSFVTAIEQTNHSTN
jgi:hypothetical protein